MKSILILVNLETTIYNFRREVVSALIENGFKVIIGLPKGNRWQSFVDMGCELIEIPVDRHGVNPLNDIKLLFTYKKIIKKLNPDLVLTYTIKPNIYGGIACRLAKKRYLSTITGLGTAVENKGMMAKLTIFLYKIGLKGASKVFFQNESNKDFLKKNRVIKDNFILTSGSGVNLKQHKFKEYPKNTNKLLILFIGRIMKDKGIEEFLDCVEYIKEKYKNVYFEMLGRDDNKIYQQRLIDMENKGLLIYHGQKPDVDEYIYNSDVVTVPSYHEGLCNVLLEASSCGRPVLTTNIPGCKETFDEGETGYGCIPKDTNAYIEIVEKFVNLSYKKRKEMGEKAREKVEREFDRNLVVHTYLSEIKNMIGD